MQILRRLGLPLVLIAAASGVLLWSDRGARRGAPRHEAQALIPIAILQHSSNALLDDTRAVLASGRRLP